MGVRRLAIAVCCGALVSVLSACQKTQDAPAGDNAASGSIQVRTPTFPLADYLPPLDEGRVELAPPKDWDRAPRGGNALTRFYKGNRNTLPRIEIRVESRTYGEIATVTRENVQQFAQLVAAELEKQGKTTLEPVIPMLLGEVPCARFVSDLILKMDDRMQKAERQRLLVLNRGRLYTIDLFVWENTLLQSRDAAYSVCASIRFVDDAEPAAE